MPPLSEAVTFRSTELVADATLPPHGTEVPFTVMPMIIGAVRSANGGFRRRIQNASQLKKNEEPWPSQSRRLNFETSTRRIGRIHFRTYIMPRPGRNPMAAPAPEPKSERAELP